MEIEIQYRVVADDTTLQRRENERKLELEVGMTRGVTEVVGDSDGRRWVPGCVVSSHGVIQSVRPQHEA